MEKMENYIPVFVDPEGNVYLGNNEGATSTVMEIDNGCAFGERLFVYDQNGVTFVRAAVDNGTSSGVEPPAQSLVVQSPHSTNDAQGNHQAVNVGSTSGGASLQTTQSSAEEQRITKKRKDEERRDMTRESAARLREILPDLKNMKGRVGESKVMKAAADFAEEVIPKMEEMQKKMEKLEQEKEKTKKRMDKIEQEMDKMKKIIDTLIEENRTRSQDRQQFYDLKKN